MSAVNSLQIPLLPESSLQRITPEPTSGVGDTFSSILDTAGNVLSSVAGAGESMGGMSPEFSNMIQQQIYWQYQMQVVSLVSNVEKSKHETQMAAIRNIRTG